MASFAPGQKWFSMTVFPQLAYRPSAAAIDAAVAKLTAEDPAFRVSRQPLNGGQILAFDQLPANLAAWFDLAVPFADQDFLVFEDERLSFAETRAVADRAAAMMQDRFAVAKGDRVMLGLRNFPEWIIAYMAAVTLGAIVVPFNAWWRAGEAGFALDDCTPRLAIIDGERWAAWGDELTARRIAAVVVRAPAVGPAHAWTAEMAAAPDAPRPVTVGHDDDATILYTSGSTGTPKGAVSTQRAVLSVLKCWAAYFGALRGLTEAAMAAAGTPPPSDPVASLQTVPLFHVTGCNALFLMCFPIGRKLVLMPKWEVAAARRLIAAERITHFVGVPTQSHELLSAPGLADHDLSSLVDIGGGGAARPASHVADLLGAFPNAAPALGYGLTETNALGCVTNGPDYAARPASTGRPTPPTSEISIRDNAFAALPPGAVGEICLRNPANMRGYWNRPEATQAALVDGWFRSGDLGYLDDDGFLFIVDRAKDIIVRGGENIAAQEVENCLYRHPGVAEAAVFGLPDIRLGEIVAAVIHPAAGARLDGASLRSHAEVHLSHFKIPARIWFSAAPLPRTASEKIDKRAVRALYSEHQENADKGGGI